MPLASDSGSAAIGVVLWLIIIAAYLVPTFIALGRRGAANTGSVIVINVFLGWSLIGWVVALAMACRSRQQPQYVYPGPGWQPPASQLPPTEPYGVPPQQPDRPYGYQ